MYDYVPGNDGEFHSWQTNLVGTTEINLTVWGILEDDFTALKVIQLKWAGAYEDAQVKTNRTAAAVQAKDDARLLYEQALRQFINQWLANNSRVSNSDRERMGLTVKADTRTPAPKPTTAPTGSINFSTRLQHSIRFADQATPTSKAKPEGVHGCEIWMKIDGPAPVDASDLSYLGTATRSPFITTFEGKYAGKTAFYLLRWVNTRGQFGPWSSVISATIAG